MSEEPKSPSELEESIVRPPRPRRRLLMGAGATASLILTLANRPALAAKACNRSTWISWKGGQSSPSQAPTATCPGDSPTTWIGAPASRWAPTWTGTTSYTTGTSFTSIFFGSTTYNGWRRKSATGTSLLDALNGGIIFQHLKDDGKYYDLKPDFPMQAVATLLNINFYGTNYAGPQASAQSTSALVADVKTALSPTGTNAYIDGFNNVTNNIVNKYQGFNKA
jgi:hypothetical protein